MVLGDNTYCNHTLVINLKSFKASGDVMLLGIRTDKTTDF